jgi:trans-AT polyketide synthase/acyltransferase/oxidoreductase domain-containing protein
MGEGLFERFPRETEMAEQQLGYSVSKLCLEDKEQRLGQTQYTQPALYVVNALSFLARQEETGARPDFVAGHSLGEYSALYAAGVFDFLTGLRLVQARGRIMAEAREGGMTALVGISAERVREILHNFAFDEIDIANLNSPQQTVISGPAAEVAQVGTLFKEAGATVMPLKVSGAFHSRLMQGAADEFARVLAGATFQPPAIPVIANCTGRPYEPAAVRETLARQITSAVRWTDTIRYLLQQGAVEFQEVGPGNVLTRLVAQIKASPV